MSYKCRYQLTVTSGNVTVTSEDVEKALEEMYGKPDYPADWYDVLNRYPVDWEKYEEQMLEVSREWPSAVFTLDITGEDELRVTREYYQNGRMYQVELQPMPEFNPTQLR